MKFLSAVKKAQSRAVRAFHGFFTLEVRLCIGRFQDRQRDKSSLSVINN
jgi:hypothetical protein